jgi:hypothetical protein
MGKDLEGSDLDIMKGLSWYLFGGTEENHEKCLSGNPGHHWDSKQAFPEYESRGHTTTGSFNIPSNSLFIGYSTTQYSKINYIHSIVK